jgi:hypothetical protein
MDADERKPQLRLFAWEVMPTFVRVPVGAHIGTRR